MQNNKGIVDVGKIWYWLFYIPITACVIIALVVMPENIKNTALQPFALDAKIMEERILNNIAARDPVLGFTEDRLGRKISRKAALALSDKQYGYKITIDGQAYYGNREFYEDAAPLAPIKYDRHTTTKLLHRGDDTITVTIDQVFPKQYARFT